MNEEQEELELLRRRAGKVAEWIVLIFWALVILFIVFVWANR